MSLGPRNPELEDHPHEVATLLTDVLGHQLDRDAMLRLAANVYDTLERSEQENLRQEGLLTAVLRD